LKTLFLKSLFAIGSIFFVTIQIGFAQPNKNQDTLQIRIEKLEAAIHDKTIKITELEKKLDLHEYAIDHFDMILTKETNYFAGIIAIGIVIAGVLSLGGYFMKVSILRKEMEEKIGTYKKEYNEQIKLSEKEMDDKIGTYKKEYNEQIELSKQALLDLKLTSEYQWGNLSVVISRSFEEHLQKSFWLAKAASHFSEYRMLLPDSHRLKNDFKLTRENLSHSITRTESAKSDGITPEQILEANGKDNWDEIISVFRTDSDEEVSELTSKLETLLYVKD